MIDKVQNSSKKCQCEKADAIYSLKTHQGFSSLHLEVLSLCCTLCICNLDFHLSFFILKIKILFVYISTHATNYENSRKNISFTYFFSLFVYFSFFLVDFQCFLLLLLFETGSHYIAVAGLKFCTQTCMASNSQRSSCFCPLVSRLKVWTQ